MKWSEVGESGNGDRVDGVISYSMVLLFKPLFLIILLYVIIS